MDTPQVSPQNSPQAPPQNSPQAPPKPLFAYRKHWAHGFGAAPFLPMTRA